MPFRAFLLLLVFLSAFAIQVSHPLLHIHKHERRSAETFSGISLKAHDAENGSNECKLCQFIQNAEKFFDNPVTVIQAVIKKPEHLFILTLNIIKASYKLAKGRAPPAMNA